MAYFPLCLPVFTLLPMILILVHLFHLIHKIFPSPLSHPIVAPQLHFSQMTCSTIETWGNDNLVKFNQRKMTQVVISHKHNQDVTPVFVSGHEPDISSSFTQLGLSVPSTLFWKTNIHSIAKHASQKLGFLSRAHGFFSPS